VLLQTGGRCWKVGAAPRAAVLVDVEVYYEAVMEALERAERSIHFLNWAFEPGTRFRPGPRAEGLTDGIAEILLRLARDKPDLDIRILCWQSALPVAATQKFFPIVDRSIFARTPVKFVLDGKLPMGACHHQKAVIIDDAIAFCGGADIGQDRWDTQRHLDDDPRRERSRKGVYFQSRHEIMALVDGPPAAALGELLRQRWRRCTGEILQTPLHATNDPWPPCVTPGFANVRVGLSRTEAAWREAAEVRECERLQLAAIAAARRCIYMENQYFTSDLICEALAERLAEPDGPEVVLISGEHSPSYFDQLTMDPTRSRFIERLTAADRNDRFRIYGPVTTLGRGIIVHAKLTIIDDVLLRIGSANMDNRSFGFDTECDLSIEAEGPSAERSRSEIARLRTGLVAHWLGCEPSMVEAATARDGGLSVAIESLRHSGLSRLRPIPPRKLGPVASLTAALHLGDPLTPWDSFRPWRRKAALAMRQRTAKLTT
jgi:phosphatidylserine/phosphatidylglycerophosphate/cardiolipin synthase-like enzyme